MTRFRGAFTPGRTLGRTGFRATTLGIGDLADRSLGEEVCVATLRRALEAGLNVVDTAPMYEDGFSEEVVGAAVAAHGGRERLFVIDKIDELDAPVAPQVDASVARLGFVPDAFVFHAVSSMDTWNALAAERFEELRGRCRFRGVSSHHPDVVRAAITSGLCDLVMFPIGPLVDPRYEPLVALARAHGTATVCFKTFGAGKLLTDTEGYGRPSSKTGLPRLSVRECVHATLTMDPDVALLGLSTPEEQDAAFEAALDFRAPLEDVALRDVKARAKVAAAEKGRVHWDP